MVDEDCESVEEGDDREDEDADEFPKGGDADEVNVGFIVCVVVADWPGRFEGPLLAAAGVAEAGDVTDDVDEVEAVDGLRLSCSVDDFVFRSDRRFCDASGLLTP